MTATEPILADSTADTLQPTCHHCGGLIVLDPRERDCCHKITLDFHAMQTDSARNSARHIVWLEKAVGLLLDRVQGLEDEVRILTEPAPKSAKGKG